MASSQAAPKSILKKTHVSDASLPSSLPVPKSDAERKRLEVAVQHARLLQEQKETTQKNLDAIEELAEYPLSCDATETQTFLSLMALFQPSDYDALIEERHANSRCGYTLCANPPRKLDLKRPWLRPKGSEMWCSDDCARRALYIKAQLDETPAWERRAGTVAPLVLYGEKKQPKSQPKNTQTQAHHKELAVERGEVTKVSDSKMDKVWKNNILEKNTPSSALPPTMYADSALHDLIEGYQPRGVQEGNSIRFKPEDSDGDD